MAKFVRHKKKNSVIVSNNMANLEYLNRVETNSNE